MSEPSMPSGHQASRAEPMSGTATNASPELTCSAGGFHAKTSALPTPARREGPESTATEADSGESLRELLASYDQSMSSWRTVQRSLFGDSTECLATLPDSGLMRSGRLYELPRWGPGMGENECTFVPTPLASDHKGGLRNVTPDRLSQFRHWISALTGLLYPNPSAVEPMMGYQTGWTELTPSAMPSSRRSRSGSRSGSKKRRPRDAGTR
jgi:hypothetical protein